MRHVLKILTIAIALFALTMSGPPPVASGAGEADRRVFTYFFYWYDATTGAHLREEDGLRYHLSSQPEPSWRNVEWFKKELRDMTQAGIDVALPVYWGYDRPEDEWSWRGLPVLTQAWSELEQSGEKPPRLGMFFDTTIVGWRDLTKSAGKQWFYSNIKDFFTRIPADQRARIDGRPVIFLFTSDWTAAMNQSTFDHVYRQFERDFGVRPYIVRETSWSYPILRWENGERVRDFSNPIRTDSSYVWGAAMHGYTDWNGYGFGEPTGVASVGPGYDDRLVPDRGNDWVRERDEGRAFMGDVWRATQSGKPFMVIETWNEIHEGSGVSETEELGRTYIDLTQALTDYFRKGG